MDDMQLLADFGAELDEETPVTLVRQRNRLLAAANGPEQPKRRSRWPVWAAGVAAAAVAVVVVATNLPGSPQRTAAPPTVTLSAYTVLNQAADWLAQQPATTPTAHQWIYRRVVEYGVWTPEVNTPTVSEYWIRFDGQQDADIENGKLVVENKTAVPATDPGQPAGLWAWLRTLPTDPKAALAALEAQTDFGSQPLTTQEKNAALFEAVVNTMWDATNYAAPPSSFATMYRALAIFPGITVDRVTDGLGQHDLGVVYGAERVLIDPTSYAMIGFEQLGLWTAEPTSRGKHMLETDPNVVGSASVMEDVAVVDAAGER